MNTTTQTIADNSEFTNALCAYALATVQMEEIKDESSVAYGEAEKAVNKAWNAVISLGDAHTHNAVAEALTAR